MNHLYFIEGGLFLYFLNLTKNKPITSNKIKYFIRTLCYFRSILDSLCYFHSLFSSIFFSFSKSKRRIVKTIHDFMLIFMGKSILYYQVIIKIIKKKYYETLQNFFENNINTNKQNVLQQNNLKEKPKKSEHWQISIT